MKSVRKLMGAVVLTASFSIVLVQCTTAPKKSSSAAATGPATTSPFENHRDSVPTKAEYAGPLFTLSHDYPEKPLPPIENAPWHAVLKGQPLSDSNAIEFVEALKRYVSPTITKFLYNRDRFNADSEGWYEEPWTGGIREAIMGTYVGSGFGPGTFSSLDSNMTTYVLTFYDKRAAYTLGQIWGKTGDHLNLKDNAAQFKEGSIIVKFAFTTSNYPSWSVMKNALTYPIYDTGTAYPSPVYAVRTVTFFQFDIIVKDTVDAPKTGWVFSTLVYDKDGPGKTAWENMVPLGAMWGNDPEVNSTKNPGEPLKEDVINTKAPEYSRQTLGWGNRLSGPNDGAIIPYASADGKVYTNLQASACMSCHLTAQQSFNSFLLPGPFPTSNSDTLPVFTPGGPTWERWFRNLPGDVSFDSGQIGLDFDMVTAFKSIPAYELVHPPVTNAAAENGLLQAAERYRLRVKNKYNGR